MTHTRIVNFSGKVLHVDSPYKVRNASAGRSVYSYDLLNFPKINAQDYLLCRVRACTADVPNNNGDCFPYEELRKSYASFIGKGVYTDHDTDTVDKIKGIILDASFKEDQVHGAWVELMLAVDRANTDLVRRIEKGQITDVSMGCVVKKGTCSICNNEWLGEVDDAGYPLGACDHVPYYKGTEWEPEKIVYENCEGVEFIEISFVTNGADPQALVLDNVIHPNAEMPSNVAKLIEDRHFNKRAARSSTIKKESNETVVRNLPEGLSNKVYALCEIVSPNRPWVKFQEVQNLSFKQACDQLKNEASRLVRSISANDQTYTVTTKDGSLIKEIIMDYLVIADAVSGPYEVENFVYSELCEQKNCVSISDPEGLILKISEKIINYGYYTQQMPLLASKLSVNPTIKTAANKNIKDLETLKVHDKILIDDEDYGFNQASATVYEKQSNGILTDSIRVYIREGSSISGYEIKQRDLDKGRTKVAHVL